MVELFVAFSLLTIFASFEYWRSRRSLSARMRQRLKDLSAKLTARSTGDDAAEAAARRRLIQGKLRELERDRRQARRDTIRHLLIQSGRGWTLHGYALACLAAGLLVGSIARLAGQPLAVCALAAFGAALFPPRVVLRIVVRRRQEAFIRHFADALDIIVRGVRSGLPAAECLGIVAREAPAPVGPEFMLLIEGQRLGMTLKQTLDRALDRMPIAEVQFFAIVLLIQQQTGGNLAATIEKLAGLLRARKRLRDKIRALSSEAKASAAIIGGLPFLVAGGMSLVRPDYMELLIDERAGRIMAIGALLWMGLGVLVMRKMIRFDI